MAGAGPVRLFSSYFPRMRSALAKIERHQAHMNVYPKFYALLNKLSIRCTLSKNDIAKGFFGRAAEVGDMKELPKLSKWYRAEAAIDLIDEIIEILEIKELLSKDALGMLELAASVYQILKDVKDPLMQNISDGDLEEIGNLIIAGTVSSKVVESSARVDAEGIRDLMSRMRRLSEILLREETQEGLYVDEEAKKKISETLIKMSSVLAQPLPRETTIIDLLRQLQGVYNYLLKDIIDQRPEEEMILTDLGGILQDLSGLLD